MNTSTSKRCRFRPAFLGLALMALLPRGLAAQTAPREGGGLDDDGRAVAAILPFTGEEEEANAFNAAVSDAVRGLQKYSPRNINAQAVQALGVGIPTDMPPLPELVPGARYALTGGVWPGNYENEYFLQLWLWDMGTSAMIYTDDLRYEDRAEGLETLPDLVEWLFSHIIEVAEPAPVLAPEPAWTDKRISLGIRSGVSRRWLTAPDESSPGAHALVYEGGIFASVFLNTLVSLQLEADFSFDHLVYRGIDDQNAGTPPYVSVYAKEKHTLYSLAFPLMVKANLRTGLFRFAPFAGLYAFVPLGKADYEKKPTGEADSYPWSAALPLGFTAGLETAIRCGPGLLVADIRYAGDFGAIAIEDGGETSFRRDALSITLGYAFGFITMNK